MMKALQKGALCALVATSCCLVPLMVNAQDGKEKAAATVITTDPKTWCGDASVVASIKGCTLVIGSDDGKMSRADLAKIYSNRGRSYDAVNRYHDAMEDFRIAIALDPKNSNYFVDRAMALHRIGDWDRAFEDLDHAIAVDANNARAYNNRSYAYYLRGDYVLALADANKAVELNGKDARHFNTRGLALWHVGRIDDAIKDFETAAKLDPSLMAARQNLAQAVLSKKSF